MTLVQQWARDDAEEASKWVNEINESDAKRRLVNDVIGAWVQVDEKKAAEWVEALTNPALKKSAQSYFSRITVPVPTLTPIR